MLAGYIHCFSPCSYQMLEKKQLKKGGFSALGDTFYHHQEGMATEI